MANRTKKVNELPTLLCVTVRKGTGRTGILACSVESGEISKTKLSDYESDSTFTTFSDSFYEA